MTPAPGSDAIVITGMEAVTCLGLDRRSTWAAMLSGERGMREMTALEQRPEPFRTGGQAPDLPADFLPDAPREVRYLRHAALGALADANLDATALAPDRSAAILGTTMHGIRAAGVYFRTGNLRALATFLPSATLKLALADLNLRAMQATTCSACSSGLGSIALAATLLKRGDIDVALAGGYDPISEYAYAGFNSLRLIAAGNTAPFCIGRDGMNIAEGYGVLVLEREADARRRGARILARVIGCGESADAHHLTQPHPEGEGAARAIQAALRDAQLTEPDIHFISAHATGTPDNDIGEHAALRRVFADRLPAIPVAAFKSHLGHTLGGAGAVELVLSAMAIEHAVAPPTHIDSAAVEFPALSLARQPRPAAIRHTLNLSLGFGGANTAIVLQSPAVEAPAVLRRATRPVFITGVGVVLPTLPEVGNEAFVQHLTDRTPLTETITDDQLLHLINARRVRRMSDYVKLTLAATAVAVADAGISDLPGFAAGCSAILGSTHGSLRYSEDYYSQLVHEGMNAANPMLFAEGVPNAGAAHLSMMLGLKGGCQSIIGSRTAALDALRLAAARIADGSWDRAIVSAAEEVTPIIQRAYALCSAGDDRPMKPGAVTFILESSDAAAARSARPRGELVAASAAPLTPPVPAQMFSVTPLVTLAAALLTAPGTPGALATASAEDPNGPAASATIRVLNR
jgi:3-oxoacyl-[acyl-carrier-protein] synthase II